MADNILHPMECAKEIVEVLEKHGITIFEMDKVLEVTKRLAYSSTHVQSEKRSARFYEGESRVSNARFDFCKLNRIIHCSV